MEKTNSYSFIRRAAVHIPTKVKKCFSIGFLVTFAALNIAAFEGSKKVGLADSVAKSAALEDNLRNLSPEERKTFDIYKEGFEKLGENERYFCTKVGCYPYFDKLNKKYLLKFLKPQQPIALKDQERLKIIPQNVEISEEFYNAINAVDKNKKLKSVFKYLSDFSLLGWAAAGLFKAGKMGLERCSEEMR